MSNKILNKEISMVVPIFSLYNAFLLWLLPIGIIAGCIQGFTAMHFLTITAGIVHSLLSIYMLLKNTLIHNILQLVLSAIFSVLALYITFSNEINGALPKFGMFNISVETLSLILIIFTSLSLIFKIKK